MTTEQLSQQVRQTLAQLQQLSRSDQPTGQVVARIHERLVGTTGGHGGLVWFGGLRAATTPRRSTSPADPARPTSPSPPTASRSTRSATP